MYLYLYQNPIILNLPPEKLSGFNDLNFKLKIFNLTCFKKKNLFKFFFLFLKAFLIKEKFYSPE